VIRLSRTDAARSCFRALQVLAITMVKVTTIEEVETSIQNAGIAYSQRGSGKLSACGCVISVDSFGKVQIEKESADADQARIERTLR